MRFKHDVKIFGARAEIAMAAVVCDSVFREFGLDMIITSVVDGAHSRTSLHYSGAAFDIRRRNIEDDVLERLVPSLRYALTKDFDVVLEDTHIHIEFQPKRD